MREKLFLNVLLPATQMLFEFRVPLDVTTKDAAWLMSSVLATEEPLFWQVQNDTEIMLLEGKDAGRLLPHDATVRDLVDCGALVDGASVALA